MRQAAPIATLRDRHTAYRTGDNTDIMKTVVKAREGKDFLVTGGPFR